MRLLELVARWKAPVPIVIGLTLLCSIGFVDYVTGNEISVVLFYILPIVIVTWFGGLWFGFASSLAALAVKIASYLEIGPRYPNSFPMYWNSAVRLGVFLLVAWFLTELKTVIDREREISRTDYLTGTINSRMFGDLFRLEIDRSRRYKRPFTLAYIDLDNFKNVNDELGHAAGDTVLRTFVHVLRDRLRKTDILARMGGDEFALLLPECGQREARAMVSKLHERINIEMDKNGWPITCSIGALSCSEINWSQAELIKIADDLMYTAKREGKNGVAFSGDPSGPSAKTEGVSIA